MRREYILVAQTGRTIMAHGVKQGFLHTPPLTLLNVIVHTFPVPVPLHHRNVGTMVGVVGKTLAFALAGQLLPALVFVPLKTERFYDLCGSLGFLTTTAFSLYQSTNALAARASSSTLYADRGTTASALSKVGTAIASRFTSAAQQTTVSTKNADSLLLGRHPRQWIGSACVFLWALRLGSFLFLRIQQSGHDPRFNEIKQNPFKFAFAWAMQGVWVALTALPVYMLNALAPSLHPALGWPDAVALCVWVFGWTLEVVADRTKATWRAERDAGKHHDKFLRRGVWSWSRHPNYFGEITLWTGLAFLSLFTLQRKASSTSFAMIDASSASLHPLLPLLSPAFEYCLIRYLSGVPMLEEKMDKKLGDDPEYKAYKSNVPCFVPLIGSAT